MLNIVEKPTGVDVAIRRLQEFLHTKLLIKWSTITADQYQSYARCNRNKKDNGYVAEVFAGDNRQVGKKDYKEVYWDDKFAAVSFFGTGTKSEHNVTDEKIDVHLVFFVDLNLLKPTLQHRPDEEVRLDVLSLVNAGTLGFSYTSMETGIENVLREYSGSYRDNALKAIDMHPIHCFRLNFSLIYNIKDCY